jgi:hypothetical protein
MGERDWMYPQARSISSSIHKVGRLVSAFPFKCLQMPSTGFSSGQATSSQRNSIPNSRASFRLLLAVWGKPRSRNRMIFQPGHWALRCRRCSWKLFWSHLSAWSKQMLPVRMFKAVYKAPLFRLSIMGTATGSPWRAHLALRGGVSVMIVSVGEENHPPLPVLQASLQPPFACRQKGSLRASTYLGRFHR